MRFPFFSGRGKEASANTSGSDDYVEGVSVVSPLKYVRDATLNSSSKSFVVPDGEMWCLNWADLTFISDATVGARQIQMVILDADGNVAFSMNAGATQAASLTRDYHFVPTGARETSFVAGDIRVTTAPDLWLPSGWTLKIWDSAAVAAATDGMTVTFQVKKFKGC